MDFEQMNAFIGMINGLLFHNWVIYILLGTGVVFTIWSGFGQYRALTHGVSVVRGKYDKADDPGAISHFQALSAALSATVGLGNIAGVALAVALGGPGAIFWMWVIGFLGMALKMTEVTQSMMHRDTSDPSNPHGGPMFVVKTLLVKQGGNFGVALGGLFCLTLILSAITGGNMFQAWNVADVTTRYFDIPGVSEMQKGDRFDPETFAIGIFLAVVVGVVIIGGVKRIGAVAGRLVPLMCGIYLIAGLGVLALNIGEIPSMIMLIIRDGLGLGSSDATGAFIGGSFGYAAIKGIQRALFSSEAGQGSSPIAHSAAKCDEPVREGVVAGIEPFIDTIVVCTITALVILTTGAWNREAEAVFPPESEISISLEQGEKGMEWVIDTPILPNKSDEAVRVTQIDEGSDHWKQGDNVFMIVAAESNKTSGTDLHKLGGKVFIVRADVPEGAPEGSLGDPIGYDVNWKAHKAVELKDEDGEPHLDDAGSVIYQELTLKDRGVHVTYAGASLTANAFDRVKPGFGKWLIVICSWLFAISTMISWSYYGEQGIVYLFGDKEIGNRAVLTYRVIYSALIAVSCIGFIQTDHELDMWTTLGLGAMLVVNIPIMWIFSRQSMKAYHGYMKKLKNGEFDEA